MRKSLYAFIILFVFILLLGALFFIIGKDIATTDTTNRQMMIQQKLVEQPNLETLTDLQDTHGFEIIADIDCAIIEDKAEFSICKEEQQRYIDIFNQIGWEDVVYLPLDEIKVFDCDTIVDSVGQEMCIDFQTKIK